MSELIFSHVKNVKYNTVSINIMHAFLTLKEDYDVINIEKTKWGYRKAVVQLNETDLCEKVKEWETRVNEYLQGKGIEPVKILYNNKIYPKTLLYNTTKNKTNYINLKGVWVNDKNKPFIQLWLQ